MKQDEIIQKAKERRKRLYARYLELGSYAAVAKEEGLKSHGSVWLACLQRKAEIRREERAVIAKGKLQELAPPPGGWKAAKFRDATFNGKPLTWEEKAKRLRVNLS